MAYDAQKAHEYYEKYRKKGLLKGRDKKKTTTKTTTKKRGRKKSTKAKQESLIGLSTTGLNDAGKMQASMIKDQIKKDMNAALANEKDPAKRAAIKQEYQNKALQEISALKNKPEYAKAKATSSKGKSGSSKASKGSKGSSGGGKGGSSDEKDEQKQTTKVKSSSKSADTALKQAQSTVNALKKLIDGMTPEERAAAKQTVQRIYDQIRAEYEKYLKLKKGGK